MGNYHTICKEEDCKVKIRKVETDAYYCKYHRCIKVLCNLPKQENNHYCEFHK